MLGCDASDSNTNNGTPSPSGDAGTTDSGSTGDRDAGSDGGSDPDSGGAPDSGKSCTSPASCPAPASACAERTCNAGVCGEKPKAAGTVVATQTAGDCKRSQCDGNGNVVTVNDDADVPDDGNDCTDDVCTNGAPSHESQAPGTACGAGAALECDGAGACVGCLTANDCAGVDDECKTRTCTAGQCGFSFSPPGTVTAAQTGGDCHRSECDGAGNIHSVVDDSDVPKHDLECTSDLCTNGVPSHGNVTAGTPCNQDGGSSCNGAGACVAPSCTDGFQNGDETGIDCGGSCGSCAPEVLIVPADGDSGVSVSEVIELTFAAPMDPATLTAQATAGACSGNIQVSSDGFDTCIGFAAPALSVGDTVVTLTPVADLAHETTYKVRVTSDVTRLDGSPIAAYTMPAGFTTESGAWTCGSAVVISQVYGGGGNSGAQYKNDFIELHNRGKVAVSLNGWSVQYAGNSGSFNNVVALSGSIAPGGYFLIQAQGGSTGDPLPTPDATTNSFNMGSTAGKVALVKATTAIGSNCTNANVLDLVGWGNANCSEGSAPAPATTNSTGVIRDANGCTDTNNNAADFTAAAPAPRNSASPKVTCVCAP